MLPRAPKQTISELLLLGLGCQKPRLLERSERSRSLGYALKAVQVHPGLYGRSLEAVPQNQYLAEASF